MDESQANLSFPSEVHCTFFSLEGGGGGGVGGDLRH